MFRAVRTVRHINNMTSIYFCRLPMACLQICIGFSLQSRTHTNTEDNLTSAKLFQTREFDTRTDEF